MSNKVPFFIVALLVLPAIVVGQIHPPKPGVEMPQAYYDRIADDPAAFQFQRAWIEKSRRAKAAREKFVSSQPVGASWATIADELRRMMPAVTVRVPIIAIDYSNRPAPYTAAALETKLYTGAGLTMTKMYDEMSYGQINLTGDVLGWANGASTDVFYEAGCNGLCGSAKTGQLILEALQGVDATTDFSQYDSDGPDGIPNSGDDDGFVDFIAIMHPEAGGECGGPNMWSHRWVVGGWPEFPGPWATNDPAFGGGFIQVWDYTIQPAKNCGGASMIDIGVYAHEFGHAFGLPDLYDTDGGGQGTGEHSLMGSGSWQSTSNPTHMCSWAKIELGWTSPIIAGPSLQTYNIQNSEVNQEIYKLEVKEEKFARTTFLPLAGTASLQCAIPGGQAAARNWVTGAGYGNSWDEQVQRTFSYNGGNHPVTLEYDAYFNCEPTYDFGYLKIDVNGTVSTLVAHDGVGTVTNATLDLTPFLNGSGASEYTIIAQFTSDGAWSDEDGLYNSTNGGPFKLDNISVTGGGETYFTDFELYEDGWCYGSETPEYFLVENHNKSGALFDQAVHGEGILIWHIEQYAAVSSGNTSGTGGTTNLRPAGVTLECADNLNQLLLGINRGDAGDIYPGTTSNTTFNNTSAPNAKAYSSINTFAVVQNIPAPATPMAVDMRGGYFPPTLASIAPNNGDENTSVPITALLGTRLVWGGTFLLRTGVTDYPASSVEWIGKLKAEGVLDLTGVPAGLYDVVWKATDGQEATIVGGFTVNSTATGIGDTPFAAKNELMQNHPNPFNPVTTIQYAIKAAGPVSIKIYNAAGQQVRTLVNEFQTPRAQGYSVVWRGRNDMGEPVASGVYLYRLTAVGFTDVKKLVLLK